MPQGGTSGSEIPKTFVRGYGERLGKLPAEKKPRSRSQRKHKDIVHSALGTIAITHRSLQTTNDPSNYQEATAGLERRSARRIPLWCSHECVGLSTIRKVATVRAQVHFQLNINVSRGGKECVIFLRQGRAAGSCGYAVVYAARTFAAKFCMRLGIFGQLKRVLSGKRG